MPSKATKSTKTTRATATTVPADTFQDPTPARFAHQFLIVAIVLVALGVLVFFLASALTGGVIALLGAIFGLGTQVVHGLAE